MKVFFVTLVIFLLTVATVLCNALYINRMSFALTERLDALPDIGEEGCAEAVRTLVNDWEQRRALAELSAGLSTVERISEQATALLVCAECGDRYGFCLARAMLRDAAEDLRRSESLPFFS